MENNTWKQTNYILQESVLKKNKLLILISFSLSPSLQIFSDLHVLYHMFVCFLGSKST